MKRLFKRVFLVSVPAALLTVLMATAYTGPVWANRVLGAQVTGEVTGLNGTAAVTINGQTYLISSSSPASKEIQSVTVGQQIGLILNGPAGASTTQVIGIVTGSSTGTSSPR